MASIKISQKIVIDIWETVCFVIQQSEFDSARSQDF